MLLGPVCQAQKVNNKGFVEKYSGLAVRLMNESSIPASIILGVAIVESGMGTSRNAKLLKNYFGIKGKNNLHKTHKGTRSAYKQYPSAAASFRDFVRIVSAKKWFSEMNCNKEPHDWLVKLNRSGYAAAKGKWIADIERTIKKYDLTRFDNLPCDYFEDNLPEALELE
jgi:flagellum-specific peptidoglycan hydrolase FlgJ